MEYDIIKLSYGWLQKEKILGVFSIKIIILILDITMSTSIILALNIERKVEFGKDKGIEKQVNIHNNELQYDIQAKKLIGTKSVFAQILRFCVPEFQGMEIEEIKEYIVDIQVLAKEVSEGYGNVSFGQMEEEKTILYDIWMIVRNLRYKSGDKNFYETMELTMNIEVQVDSKHLDYIIEHRSICYAFCFI